MGDAVKAGEYTGPAHNSVTSSDGKVQIRNFEVFWTSTDDDMIKSSLSYSKYSNGSLAGQYLSFSTEPKLQINWALSGEVQYSKGAMTISIPDMQFKDENDLKYPFGSYSIPKAKFKEDGSIDLNANYNNATLAYYYDEEEKVTKIINVLDLAPGASGTFTLSYGNNNYKGNPRWLPNPSIHQTKPTINLKYNNESLKTHDKTLKIELKTVISSNIEKHGKLFKTWQDEWGDEIKPPNHEDYWYAAYKINLRIYDYFQTNYSYELIDNLKEIKEYKDYYDFDKRSGAIPIKTIENESDREIIAYSDLSAKEYNYSLDKYLKDNGMESPNFTNKPMSKNKIEWPSKDININDNEGKKSPKYHARDEYAYVLEKIPAKKLGYMDKKKSHYITIDNSATLNVLYKNSNNKKDIMGDRASLDDTYTYYPDVEFTAPPGDMFKLEKRSNKDKIPARHDIEKNGVNVFWTIDGSSRAANLTYDEKYGDKNNPNAYGKKNVKYELVDDYLYLGDNYSKELTSNDYNVKKVSVSLKAFDYKQFNPKSKADYMYATSKISATLYLRKESTGKWEKGADFNAYNKYNHNGGYYVTNIGDFQSIMTGVNKVGNKSITVPDGYSSVKISYETNHAGVDLSMYIEGLLKPSKRVIDYVKGTKSEKYNADIVLRNDSTFLIYNEEGKMVGIKGTTDKTTPVERTLDLDKINYNGEEMYHYPAIVHLYQEYVPSVERQQELKKSMGNIQTENYYKRAYIRNDVLNKQFIIPVYIQYIEDAINTSYYPDLPNSSFIHVQNSGTFYDLLPLGVTGVENVQALGKGFDRKFYDHSVETYVDKDTNSINLKTTYKLIPNWRNSGRTMLIAKFNNAKYVAPKDKLRVPMNSVFLSYNMIYPWDSYKDYGSKIQRNLVAYESGFDEKTNDKLDNGLINNLEDGYRDSEPGFKKSYRGYKLEGEYKIFTDQEIEWMKDLNPNHDEKRFLYAQDSTSVSGDTEANIGLTKHIKDERDSGFKLKTKTREGGHYQYKIRLQAAHATTVSNLVFFDSLENYDPLKADEDYGVKRWRGELESIDVIHPIMKGVDPKIYVSTVPKVDIEKHNDVSDSSIWKLYKEGDDLSKVTGIAVDLRKNKDGSDFKLEQDTAINVYLNMKAPWDMKDKRIDPEAKALNAIFAKHTVSTSLDNKSDKLIYTAYTAIGLEPVETEIQLQANKKHLDQEGKEITLKGDDFTFELRDKDNNLLQTKTNDKDGKITFDPIKYNTWNVGNHQYKIVEKKGNSDTTAYDNHEEVVNVKVERSGDSELKATITYDEDGANFTNREINPVKATIKAQKVYYGESGQKEKPKAKAFEFILKNSEGKEISKATNDAEGNIVFKEMTFTAKELGKHKYTIEEKQGKDPKIEYDKHKEDVTITVSMTEDYKLQAKVDYTNKDGAIFTNKVKTQLKYLPETGSTIQIFLIGSVILFVIASTAIIIKRKSKVRE